MIKTDIKKNIEQSISDFAKNNLYEASKSLLNSLGYSSDKTLKLSPNNFSGFSQVFDVTKNNFNKEKAGVNDWGKVEIIFQIGDDDLSSQSALFDTKRVDNKIIKSFLFIAAELKNDTYNRSTLAKITREVNKLTSMPAIILFKYNNLLTISIIDRRLHKREESKDVLEKVTLIKDIFIPSPSQGKGKGEVTHRAHIEILFDLSFDELQKKHIITNFVGLHSAWQKTLDTKELNRKFYEKLFNWYLWALKNVKFPQIRADEDMLKDEIHQSESLIRLLTRILFVWFMKEKGLINSILFDKNKLQSILKNFAGDNGAETIYYKAILQNLFFATLNKPIEHRKVIDKGFNPKEYGDPLVYRYDELFKDSKNFLKLFENIPFLNGGLFECLDQKKDKDNPVEIRLDGFSTKKGKQPIVPDKLFFGEYKNIDLSKDYDDKKKNKQTVFGLIDILNQYKFTIEENTPIEEEVALDPELLGKVFENLLASYNPETRTTARKQTGSFYTPREIVNYMVDESIIAYLKNHINDEERLRMLLSYNKSQTENPFNEKETLTLLKAIDSCKILDPACGSGAFPMGILQKMILILHKLDPTNKLWFDMVVENIPAYMRDEFRKRLSKESWNYVRKLGIIQQCIYGVDIQPIATQIAKLRFFIALLVDQDDKPNEYNRGFEPLPNLDFKIVTANTLISAPASDVKAEGLFEDQADPFFEQFDILTEQYFTASIEKDKRKLRKDITGLINKKCEEKIEQIESSYASEDERVRKALKEKKKEFIASKENEIKLWRSYPNIFKHESVGFFEPRYFFPKVDEGFHIIIGNPPWVSLIGKHGIEENKRNINLYLKLFNGNTYMPNLYEYFILKSLQLLLPQGILVFVLPDRFGYNSSMAYLRKRILLENKIKEIIYRWEFESIIADTMTIVLKNERPKDNHFVKIRYRPVNDALMIEQNEILTYDDFVFKSYESIKTFDLVKKIRVGSTSLKEYCHITSGFGGKSELITSVRTNKKQMPVLKGASIEKYLLRENYYFEFIDKNITGRTRDEYKLSIKEKILLRKTGNRIIATYDDSGIYPEQSLYFLYNINKQNYSKFLLGLINSKLMTWYFLNELVTNIDSTPQLKTFSVESFPIREKNSDSISNLVDQILAFKKQNPQADTSELEYQIDQLVYKLYDLTNEEIAIVEGRSH